MILNTENTKRANEIAILARSVNILETEDESESRRKMEPKLSNNIDNFEQSTNLDIPGAASVSSKYRQVSRSSTSSPTRLPRNPNSSLPESLSPVKDIIRTVEIFKERDDMGIKDIIYALC